MTEPPAHRVAVAIEAVQRGLPRVSRLGSGSHLAARGGASLAAIAAASRCAVLCPSLPEAACTGETIVSVSVSVRFKVRFEGRGGG